MNNCDKKSLVLEKARIVMENNVEMPGSSSMQFQMEAFEWLC